jgi:hypothetical protein
MVDGFSKHYHASDVRQPTVIRVHSFLICGHVVEEDVGC